MEEKLEEAKLKEIESKARDNHIPIMLNATAVYLADLCLKEKPKNILEIGTAVGYSGIQLLLNSGE